MELLRGVALVAATITTGLMAGVFGLYTHTIMPGLRRTDDRTFVAAFQSIDKAIINNGRVRVVRLTCLTRLRAKGPELDVVIVRIGCGELQQALAFRSHLGAVYCG